MVFVRFKQIFRKVPLFGGLVDARLRDCSEALTEVGIGILFSIVPVWFGALVLLAGSETAKGWWDLILDNLRSGELFLYSTALLAPLYYFILKEGTDIPNFPSKRSFIIAATIILLISVGLFAVQRAGELFGGVVYLDQGFIFSLSWKTYLGGVVLVYLACVYKNLQQEGAAEVARTDTDEFLQMYTTHRRSKE